MDASIKSEDEAWAEVLNTEHAAIEKRRAWLMGQKRESRSSLRPDITIKHANARPGRHPAKSGEFSTRGLAFSGGGIRSAAFSLGALQALEVDGQFEKFDYISTVSGGGYTGTALTAAMSKNGGKFPFVDAQDKVSDSATVRHIRDFSNYLIPMGLIDLLRDLGIVFRGLAAIAMIVLPVLLLLAAFTLYFNRSYDGLSTPPVKFWFGISWPLFDDRFAWTQTLLLFSPLFFGLWAIWRSVQRSIASEFSGWAVNVAAAALALFGITAFLELQPFLVAHFGNASRIGPFMSGAQLDKGVTFESVKAWAVAAGSVIATVSAFARKLADIAKTAEAETGWKANTAFFASKLALWIGALALPVFLWLVYLLLVYWAIPDLGFGSAPEWFSSSMCGLASWFNSGCANTLALGSIPPLFFGYFGAAIVLLAAALLLGPNANSLHKLYRDRLEAAFIASETDGDTPSAVGMKLTGLDTQKSPYHIINAALNIQGARDANRRERNADFFHFSKDFSGSRLSGYCLTSAVETDNRVLTLASAMAISGAAVSSNMGSASIRALTPTLALLNLRLGYWLRNPAVKSSAANLFFLFKEMFWRLTNKDKWLYLTDGGHIENLGVYVLLKRRCKFILAIDAEADGQMTFGALAKLERYARIDLGCRINIYWQAIADAHAKATAPGNTPASGSTGPHCAVGEITYQDGGKGVLIYVKSSLTGDENNYVRDYARRHPAFPHETTGDQFFKEEQFEAYRALGFHAMHGVFRSNKPDTLAVPNAKPTVFNSTGNKTLAAARAALGA